MRCHVIRLMVMLCASPVAAQQTGLDRLTSRDEALGWEAVGRVDIGDDAFCTGTLIATDLVLTAAHCLFDHATGAAQEVSRMRFRAGLRDGVAVAEARVSRAIAHPGYDPHEHTGENSIGHDVALLQLAEPIPAAVAAPFTVAEPGGVKEVSVVSYARGREQALSWQRSCDVMGHRGPLLAFNCNVDFGSSGAPVFDRSGGRARIVSIISAGNKDADGVVAFGMELPGLLGDLKAALRVASQPGAATGPSAPIRRIAVGAGTRNIGAHFVRP